jgi:hypothetical protein
VGIIEKANSYIVTSLSSKGEATLGLCLGLLGIIGRVAGRLESSLGNIDEARMVEVEDDNSQCNDSVGRVS